MRFIPIEYNDVKYPNNIDCWICEVAGHFDKESIEQKKFYSLHTEYSYGKRDFSSKLIQKYNELKTCNKNNVPQLWKSKKWAEEFANYIIELTNNHEPTIIEIHPPFNDYSNFNDFIECYKLFELKIRDKYKKVKIVIENRAGSIYKGGRFILSKVKDIVDFCEIIKMQDINLRLVVDFPQILTAENIDTIKFDKKKFKLLMGQLKPYRDYIEGIHIWAKKKNENGRWVAHCGNFDTFFDNNSENKELFVNEIISLCDDDKVRFLVPEVNSSVSDLYEIIKYFLKTE